MPHARRLRWPVLLTTLAVIATAIVVVRGALRERGTERGSRIVDAIELAPRALGEGERLAAGAGLDPQSGVRLSAGAWVEVADPSTGRLAQRYRASRVEPLPEEWVRLGDPRATFIGGSGRIVTVEGLEAIAHVPRRALDSGRIEGEVVIRMYRPVEGRAVDPAIDAPMLEVHTDEAEFDAALGQLRCDRLVDVRTPALRFTGRGLTMLLDAAGDAPERVEIEEPVEPIRIDLVALERERSRDAAAKSATAGAGQAASRSTQASAVQSPTVQSQAPHSQPPQPPPASASPASPGGAPAPAEPRFFRLTLTEEVVVVRERDGVRSVVEGDQLAIIFSLEGASLREAVAAAPSGNPHDTAGLRAGAPGSEGASLPHRVAALTVASMPTPGLDASGDRPGDAPAQSDTLTITYTGRLVMQPTEDPADRLGSVEETRIEIVGSPVRFEDPEKELVGRCRLLRYDALPGRIELAAGDAIPLEISAPRLELVGERLWAARGSGTGRIDGAGRMLMKDPGSGDGAKPVALACASEPGARDAASAALLAQLVAGILSGRDDGQAARRDLPLEIVWQDGVDLRFEPAREGDEGGRLRAATFAGDVKVSGEDFLLRADHLDVAFDGAGGAEDAISRIDAAGAVKVERLGETGAMDAERMSLAMTRYEGRSIPERLIASGAVAVRDARQVIRSQALDVSFRPRAATAPDEARGNSGRPAGDALPAGGRERPANAAVPAGGVDDRLGNVEIEKVLAERDVRVQLEDGARVYADRLAGDSIRGTLRLEGEDVMIVRDRVVADRLRDVRFDDATRTVHAPGAGRFRYFAEPPAIPPIDDAERPRIAAAPTMEATWSDAFHHDDRARSGGGEIRLVGAVDVRSTPEPREVDTVRARELHLGLARTERGRGAATGFAAAPRDGTAGESRRDRGTSDDALAGRRDIVSMTAIGGADLEAKRWATEDRSGLPEQLFRVRGERVAYDFATRNAAVEGAGQLLIHDVTPDRAPEEAAPGGGRPSAFGRRGTSTFSFANGMTMTALDAERSLITLDGSVEVLYAGVRSGDELTLATDRLEITIRRTERGAARRDELSGVIDLGGGAEVLRLRAIGRVLVRAPEQDIHCWEFDYNAGTGIAQILARPGSMAHVDMRGATTPLRAEAMIWDLQRGTIQLRQAGAAIGR
ncbi:MAG TPA: hypothetical protein PKC43_08670 [Phycisphaerales bacterium]|nr:hypothetical protein [Phycisphaerales bacterium]HMP37508.1 hypothetical protein [Phycisphaerales bacterium]